MSTTLSRAAYDRLAAELDDLTTRGRVDIARKIEDARALGDLSENGDYHAAKESQGHMEARIRQLEALLKDAIVSDDSGDPDVVSPGSVVRLRYDGDGEDDAEEYLVGSVEERRDGLAVVSTESPLGKALMGRRAGPEPITYQAPNDRDLTVFLLEVRT
ncbi:MAG: transcription elongation factor GreA [Acidimicrobiales bacterium]